MSSLVYSTEKTMFSNLVIVYIVYIAIAVT